jgi:hypothetical protein
MMMMMMMMGADTKDYENPLIRGRHTSLELLLNTKGN